MAEKENSGLLSVCAYPRSLSTYFLSPSLSSLFIHPHWSSWNSPAGETSDQDMTPVALCHWDHTATLGLRGGLWGKGNTPTTQFAVCSLPTEPVLTKLYLSV